MVDSKSGRFFFGKEILLYCSKLLETIEEGACTSIRPKTL